MRASKNQPIPIRPEIALMEDDIESLQNQPSISNLLNAIASSLKCGSSLKRVMDKAVPVIAQDPEKIIKEIKKYKNEKDKWKEIQKYDELCKLSPITALSELFWQLLNDYKTYELWTDGKRILSIDQYVKYISEEKSEEIKSTSKIFSEEEVEKIRNIGYQSAIIDESIQKESNLLNDQALLHGFEYLPWGIFTNEYTKQNNELTEALSSFTKLIKEYYQEETINNLSQIKNEDSKLFCIIFTSLARRISSHLLKQPLIDIYNIEDYIAQQTEINESNCIFLEGDESEKIIFDFISTSQNIALLCSSLNIDPIENNLLSQNEFNRIYFEDFPCLKIMDAIICPNIVLETIFLPPSAILKIIKNLNRYESKDYDLIDIIKYSEIEGINTETNLYELKEFIMSNLAYECDDDSTLDGLNDLKEKIVKLIKLWNFKFEDLDILQRHTSHQLLSEIQVQEKIKIALKTSEKAKNLKHTLPLKWLKEDPPVFSICEESHPVLTVIEFCSSTRCIQSRPNEWLDISISFWEYGFKRLACAITALMLISEAKLIKLGDNAKINPHELTNFLSELKESHSFSMVEFAIELYLSITEEKISQSRYEFLIEFTKRKNALKISTVVDIKTAEKKNSAMEKYPKFNKLGKDCQDLLNPILTQLKNNDIQTIFAAQAIITGSATAVEHELRLRAKGSFLNINLVDELNESRIRVKHKKGPDGLKAFANIIRNFQGFSSSSQDLLIGFKSIVSSNKKETFISLISRLADLSNTRHGDLSDFGANQWLKRIEEIRIILEDEGLLAVLCETA
jgi:hypothetical protein